MLYQGIFFAESFRKNPGGIALKKYTLRLLFPLAIFELFNCVVKLVEFTVTGKELDYSIYIIAKSIIGYPLGALWFMKACIIGAIILYPFMKKQKAFIGVLIGLLLYSFALLCNNYYFIIQNTCLDSIIHQYISIFDTARNGLFVGFPLLGLGVLLHDVHKKDGGLFTLLSLCMLIAEILLTQGELFLDDGSLYVSQLVFIPCLVNLLLNLQCRIPEKTFMICRNLSTGIYLLHRPMMSITFIGFTVVFHTLPSSWMLFAMAITSSVLICLCAYHYKIPVLERLLK